MTSKTNTIDLKNLEAIWKRFLELDAQDVGISKTMNFLGSIDKYKHLFFKAAKEFNEKQ